MIIQPRIEIHTLILKGAKYDAQCSLTSGFKYILILKTIIKKYLAWDIYKYYFFLLTFDLLADHRWNNVIKIIENNFPVSVTYLAYVDLVFEE